MDVFEIIKENVIENGFKLEDEKIEKYVEQFYNEVEEQEIEDKETHLNYFVTSIISKLEEED